MKKISRNLIVLSSVVACLICVLNSNKIANEFTLVILYPLLYGVFFLILSPFYYNRTRGGRITVSVFLFLQWLRLVLLPALGALSGYFIISVSAMDPDSALLSAVLVAYETVVTFLTAYLILRYSRRSESEITAPTELAGNYQIYLLYILFALAVFIKQGANQYSLFMLDPGAERRVSVMDSGDGYAVGAIIDYGLTLLVVLLLYFCVRKYTHTGHKRYMHYALLVALGRICIISSSSEGRLAILYPAGTFLILLPKLYPQYRKTIVRSIVIAATVVIGLLTVYKVFLAFYYGSYLDALKSGTANFDTYDTAGQLDSYFYGVRTIAKNLYVNKRIGIGLKTLIIDFGRNTFGLHYLFGDVAETTLGKYNMFLYGGASSSGHLYSALAYGSAYLSGFLAPIMTMGNLLFAAWIEQRLMRIRHMDSFYIVCLVYIRMVYNIFACFPMAWNYASRTLILGIAVVGGSSLLRKFRFVLPKGRR